ncbi:hypothetical protein SJAV_22520 [Sulfurisphaera javensis]|uniref:Uncharacterized protein n=1 Tax=Sulfurisphaera javensis TaxID=2049879 RepID=A0AAT9GU06_9CREN
MPRKKKTEESQQSADKKPKKKLSSKEKYVDPNVIIDEYLDEVINSLGLAYLNLEREEFKELIKEPFAAAVGEVKTKPKARTIINRLQANRDSLMEFLALKLLRIKDLDKMTDEQLEFVVYNIKSAIKDLGPRLYEELVKRNRQDLIDFLRSTWATYGINSPIECPRCKFNAIMPDLSCYICKYIISMKQLKEEIHVIDLLIDYSKVDPEGFKEIISSGYFYYSWSGVSPPSKMPKNDPLVFEIVLNKDEKEKLKSYYNVGNTPPH